MKSKLFIINGIGGSGKDTFVEYIKKHSIKNIFNIASSNNIKEIARTDFGWDGRKDEKGRKLLSTLMQASREYNDGVFNFYCDRINFALKNLDVLYFLHVRESEEIKKYVKVFGCKTILVYRPNIIAPDNNSDNSVYDFLNYDIVIDNIGTLEELEQKAINFKNRIEND